MKATATAILSNRLRATVLGVLTAALFATGAQQSHAGAYIFAGESNGISSITHPSGYTGAGGNLQVEICIDPSASNADQMELSIENVVRTVNRLSPVTPNLSFGLPSGSLDFESVALHEVGHCLGLAHVNLASESGLLGSDRNYTKATDGADNTFGLNPGVDGIIGSADDQRGDDVNLHWFNADNNPFTLPGTIDASTYSLDAADLPAGDSFAANADRAVGPSFGFANSEAVMQQGTFSNEMQRELIADDVATLELAMSGLDETAGTADDYTIELVYGGKKTGCDINVKTNTSGLAFCSTGGSFVGTSANGNIHWRITSADAVFNSNISWFFNDVSNAIYQLNIVKDGSGSGVVTSDTGGIDCGSTCSADFADGTSVTLTASADEGSSFDGWSGGGCSGTGSCQLTMDAAKSVTATFTTVPTGPPEVDLILDQTDNGQYGNGYGSNQHRTSLFANFDSDASQDLVLSVTGYDIDFADEVAVYLNDQLLGYLSTGANNGLNGGDALLLPQAQLNNGANRIEFRQRSDGFIWGVTGLLVSTSSAGVCLTLEVCLTVGQTDNGQYGNGYGSNQHRTSLFANFDSDASQDLVLSVTGYDIDFADEVAVYLNDQLLGYLSTGANNGLNGGDALLLPQAQLNNGANRIEFRQRSDGFIWGVTGLLVSTSSAGVCLTLEVCLTVGQTDNGQYGNGYGSNQHRTSLFANFDSDASQDLVLSVTGYDIDFADEVAVYLNDQLLGYLSTGANNGLNGGDALLLPQAQLNNGANRIEFRQRSDGFIWGVTGLLVSTSSAGVCLTLEVCLTVGQTDNGQYGNGYGSNQHRTSLFANFDSDASQDLVLSVTGYDIDFADEVAVYLNDQLLGYLSTGANNGLNGGDALLLPQAQLNNGANRIEFRQRSDGFIWGVTGLLVSTSSAGVCLTLEVCLTVGQTDNGQYGNGYGSNQHRTSLFANFDSDASQDLVLSVTGYDIDFADEVAVYLNDQLLGYLSTGANNGLNGGDALLLPQAQLNNGANRIEFRQRSDGFIWGVTAISVNTAP